MKQVIAVCLFLVVCCVLFASAEQNSGADPEIVEKETVMLARVLYAEAHDQGYDTKVALGTVVMNRVASRFFPDSVEDVLASQHAFPAGEQYDDESLEAAEEVMNGTRAFGDDVLWYRTDGTDAWGENGLVATVGSIAFYNEDGYGL